MDSSPYSYFSNTVRVLLHKKPKCGTEPIRYVTLNFRDRRSDISATQLRNVTEIRAKIFEGHLLEEWISHKSSTIEAVSEQPKAALGVKWLKTSSNNGRYFKHPEVLMTAFQVGYNYQECKTKGIIKIRSLLNIVLNEELFIPMHVNFEEKVSTVDT